MAEAISGDATVLAAIGRRPATAQDMVFLRAVYDTTRADEMALVPWDQSQKEAFLRMQFHAQHTYYHEQFPNASYDILLENDVPIGRIYIDRQTSELRILDIALLPEYRNRGIGSMLMREVLDEASASGVTVTLHVESFNRAQSLYRRLGFERVREDGPYLYMVWKS